MRLIESCEQPQALGGQGHMDPTPILLRRGALSEFHPLEPVHQADCAVMGDLHAFGEFAHRNPIAARLSLNHEQRLVLLWGDPVRPGGFGAEAEKFSERVTKRSEGFVVALAQDGGLRGRGHGAMMCVGLDAKDDFNCIVIRYNYEATQNIVSMIPSHYSSGPDPGNCGANGLANRGAPEAYRAADNLEMRLARMLGSGFLWLS